MVRPGDCPLCSKQYSDRRGLKKHMIMVHHAKFQQNSRVFDFLEGVEFAEAKAGAQRKQRNSRQQREFKVAPVGNGVASRVTPIPVEVHFGETSMRDAPDFSSAGSESTVRRVKTWAPWTASGISIGWGIYL
jgi:hypothetical protein